MHPRGLQTSMVGRTCTQLSSSVASEPCNIEAPEKTRRTRKKQQERLAIFLSTYLQTVLYS
uniref:Uncharacterized protein n=1 Tax=Nelumbo nucifera TaxID=4432 RepID=A0A822ZLM6_NELNU|nr:TPA_asm: hypothetical protein HUJ06_003600 [Nelumbo nucifera]